MHRIYCDYNATTPLHPRVLARMVETAQTCSGNPSSVHSEGRQARQVVEQARAQVAALIAAHPSEIVFTSGGTESNNLALRSTAALVSRLHGRPARFVSSGLEHPSVRQTLSWLSAQGCDVRELRCDAHGRLAARELAAALEDSPADVVSLALCNHELGNLYPIAELSAMAHAHGALLHCDAVQAVGRVPVSVRELDVDLLSLSAHKLMGPKGAGALYVRPRRAWPATEGGTKTAGRRAPQPARAGLTLAELPALLCGGPQERGLRPGTENLLGIVGLGEAALLCREELLLRWAQVAPLRDALESRLLATIAGARRHGDGEQAGGRAPGTSNLAFDRVEGELLLMNLDLRGIAVSTGAACSSGSLKPSPVLLALGLSEAQAREGIRISLGPDTTSTDIDRIAAAICDSVAQVRAAC
jgi:cysteine desulfurase